LERRRIRLATCYNDGMPLTENLSAYLERWKAVEAIQQEERRSASIELRWRQLNAAYGLAKGLGLLRPDPSEAEVYERWAKLKEKAARRPKDLSDIQAIAASHPDLDKERIRYWLEQFGEVLETTDLWGTISRLL
jgi:hypothetical protein